MHYDKCHIQTMTIRIFLGLCSISVGDTENGPESDILGQASAGIGMDPCLDFFRHEGERRELGIGYCSETQDYFDLCFFSNR